MRQLAIGYLRLCVALPLLLAWVFCFSCSTQPADFKIETSSPDGRYRLKLEGRGEPTNPGVGELQRQIVTLESTRDAQPVAVDGKFFSEDSLDELFQQRYPVNEWVSSSVLRFGDLSSKDQFKDRLLVTNRTEKQLDLVIVYYGKYEVFFIYDLAPGKEVELNASPQLHTSVPAATVFYRAFVKLNPFTGNVGGSPKGRESKPITLAVDIVD